MTVLLAIYAAALGAIIGSFLNVVIHRYPREESIVFPPSRCASCGTKIKPYDNIPLLSYVILRGRCRRCGVSFSARYPLVELANALFYLAIYLRTGPSLLFLPVAALVSMTILLIFIDADIQILPDVIDLPGIVLGFGIGALASYAVAAAPALELSDSLLDSLIGAALGAGLLLVVAIVYKLVRRVEGMGLGDVKMLAMIGAASGWQNVLPVVFLASVSGAVVGVTVALRQRRGLQFAMPFGVFLGLAWLAILFFGEPLFALYLRLMMR